MAGMKQQRCVALDADVADSQERRAGGLATTHNAKQFAAGIRLIDDRLQLIQPATPAPGFRGSCRGRRRRQHASQRDQSNHVFHEDILLSDVI